MSRGSVSYGIVSLVPHVIDISEEKEKENGSELFKEIIIKSIKNLVKKIIMQI